MTQAVKIWRRAKKNYQYLGKKGKVDSLTRIVQAPVGFESQAPYWTGVISLWGGRKVIGQLVDREGVKRGDKVVGVLRRIKVVEKDSVIEYGVKFKKLMIND
jgi:uncharacterized OB-fold protein